MTPLIQPATLSISITTINQNSYPPDAISYAEDLKKFPRSQENIPEWLQEELRKAEAEQD